MSYPLILYELRYVHSPVVPGLTRGYGYPEAISADSLSVAIFIDNLKEMLLPDLARKIVKEFIFNATSTRAAPGLLGLDPIRSKEQRT
jgi:hypothetical protein